MLIHKTAKQLGDMIAAGETTSVEVTTAFLDRIEALNDRYNAFLHIDREGALAAAADIDAKIAAGERPSPLAGVPIGVKDNFCTSDMPTTCGSKMLEGWIAPYDSTAIRRVREAGLVIVGKTNMDEFAMGSSTETSAYGPTRNPWDTDRIPGGSGGGSAAAVAAHMVPIALGSDTGGSIRQPAAVTGTVGVKPTYGSVSRYGVVAMASSLDQPGPCARTMEDAALLHQIIGGHDGMDQTSLEMDHSKLVAEAANDSLDGLRVGIIAEFTGEGIEADVLARFEEAVELLRTLGAETCEVRCPQFEHSIPVYYLIHPSELSSNLARFDGMRYGLRAGDDGTHSAEEVMALSRGEGLGKEAKRRIIIGTYALSAGYADQFYGQAQKVRTLVIEDFNEAFKHCDVLISPSTPSTAFKIGERTDDPMAMYMADLCTIPSNLAGNASASVPVGLSEDGLPVGLQIIAPVMQDALVYRVGGALQRALEKQWGAPLTEQIQEVKEG